MKLTGILLLATCLQVSASGMAQKVTLSLKNADLGKIFTEVIRQTGVSIVYNEDIIKAAKPVTIQVENESVEKVLELCLANQPFRFISKGKFYSVEPTTPGLSEKDFSPALLPPPPITVRGRILNEKNEPVIASVVIKGTKKGTTTDENGVFELNNVDDDAVLVITASNIEPVSLNVNGKSDLIISVKTTASSLSEVVINKGYYTEKQRLSTGNVIRIDAKEIEKQPVTSPLLALQGRVPGLEITPVNGAPGVAPKIRVRGETSLTLHGTTKKPGYPLYIVDGVILESNPITGVSNMYLSGFDPLININPENIESIEVLKDADATSIYGSRGANGVILIKTKQAYRKDLSLNVNTYHGIGKIPHYVDLLNTEQYLEMRKEAFDNFGITPGDYDYEMTFWDSKKYTDWQKELLSGSANITDIQTNLAGGSDNTSFRIGVGYHKETTFISDNFGYNRLTASFNFNHWSANKKLNISFSANYGASKNQSINLGYFVRWALALPPNAPSLYEEDGTLNWGIKDFGFYKLATFENPISKLLNSNEAKINTLVANTNITYNITSNLSAKLNVGYTDGSGNESVKNTIASIAPIYQGWWSTGDATFGTNKRNSWIVEPQINYSHQWVGHSLDVLIGGTFQEHSSINQTIAAYGYTSDILLESIRGASNYYFTTDDNSMYRYTAMFARLGYNFNEKYLINLTGRRDGSSRFGTGKQFGNFGAIGATWIFSEEKLFKRLENFLSFGKLRGSYGITGSDNIGDYQYYNLFSIAGPQFQNLPTLVPNGLFNPEYRWEATKKVEATLELSFIKGRISLQSTWYKNKSSNQLINFQLPATTGFTSILTNFNAVVENTGWEFLLRIDNLRKKNIHWSTSFNLTVPKNKLVSFPNIEGSPYSTTYKVGEPLSVQFYYQWKGVDTQTGAHTIVDVNEDGIFDNDDRKFVDVIRQKYYAGIINNIKFRSLEFSFLLQLSNQSSGSPYGNYPGYTNSNQPVEVLNRWKKPGEITNIAKFTADYSPVEQYYDQVLQSDYNITNASFVKLKSLTLAYSISEQVLSKLNIKSCNIFLQGQNLFTSTNFIGMDPETGYESMPQLRMITTGINLKF